MFKVLKVSCVSLAVATASGTSEATGTPLLRQASQAAQNPGSNEKSTGEATGSPSILLQTMRNMFAEGNKNENPLSNMKDVVKKLMGDKGNMEAITRRVSEMHNKLPEHHQQKITDLHSKLHPEIEKIREEIERAGDDHEQHAGHLMKLFTNETVQKHLGDFMSLKHLSDFMSHMTELEL